METVVVGSIGAPYGVRGWVRINSFTEPAENIFAYPLWLDARTGLQEVEIVEFRAHGEGYVACLGGVADRDAAALLTNIKLVVNREDLPELTEGNYYWNDMLGMEVTTHLGERLGIVQDIFATGANDVLVVRGEKEYLIPLVMNEFVLEVDPAKKAMKVHWELDW